jgi:hypothetical protein
MNKIESFYTGSLHNAEHFQFMFETNAAVKLYTPAILGITDVVSPFYAAFEKENAAIKVEQGSVLSEAAQTLDNLRDRTWKSAELRIQSGLLSPFEQEVESAKALKRIFYTYGDIRRHPANEESGEMTNLTEDLLRSANETDLKNLNLFAMIPELENENNQYINTVKDRNEDISGRGEGNVKAVRLEVDPAYDLIVETINASITLNLAKPEVAKFVEEHNKRIKTYEATLTARETLNKKEKTKKDSKKNTTSEA